MVLSYTLLEFISDVDREFTFLKTEFGVTEDSSSHTARATPFGFRESVFTTSPTTTFASARGRITICHDSRGAVEVNIRSLEPAFPSTSVQELARAAGGSDVASYREVYDSTREQLAQFFSDCEWVFASMHRIGSSPMLALCDFDCMTFTSFRRWHKKGNGVC